MLGLDLLHFGFITKVEVTSNGTSEYEKQWKQVWKLIALQRGFIRKLQLLNVT